MRCFAWRTKPPENHLRVRLADTYTEFNQGVLVELFVLADSDEQVFEFLNHLISDIGGESEGELGELMEAHGIRQYFKAAEAPWQNGLGKRNSGIWQAAARKAIKDVGRVEACGTVTARLARIFRILTCAGGHRSRIQSCFWIAIERGAKW